jgi:ribonuclease Z
MKPGFHQRMLNGYFGDPCLFIRVPWEKRALQFDLGDITGLSASEIYKISDAFVSHAHIDHFIGFDVLLRMIVKRTAPLNVYGPSDIAARVQGKLRGYTWNLIHDYPTKINVFAFDGKKVTRSAFQARNKFRKEIIGETDAEDGLMLKDPAFRVNALTLSHGIPCNAYSLTAAVGINIDKDMLQRKGLKVGPWLTDFKKLLRENQRSDHPVVIEGKIYTVGQLMEIVRFSKGQKISYATDVGISRRNVDRLVDFVKGSDVLYCEAYFLEEDIHRARERFHLTAKVCGKIGREAGVSKLVPIHFSPKYKDCPERIIEEAMKEFKK